MAKHAGQTSSICMNNAVPSRSCFLTLRLRTPNKDKLFSGNNKVSHYCFHYPIEVPVMSVTRGTLTATASPSTDVLADAIYGLKNQCTGVG